MSTAYFEKQALYPALIQQPASEELGLVVVIPCFNEPALNRSLQALLDCFLPPIAVEVIVIINGSEKASEAALAQNEQTYQETQQWIESNPREGIAFHAFNFHNLPPKHAGVGLARKIGMDEAARRLEMANRPEGIIACFDADSNCDPNYFLELYRHFEHNPIFQACSIHFEHPLEGQAHQPPIYQGIIHYELYLRYFRHALAYTGYPHPYYTIGSSMAVRAKAYQEQGGMNKRKAGEDFYFLQKFFPLGGMSELKRTRVIPSPRPSDRVPFGTGKAVNEIVDQTEDGWQVYAFAIFEDLRLFCEEAVPRLYALKMKDYGLWLKKTPQSINAFLQAQDFAPRLEEIKANSTNPDQFATRFYRWFNRFTVLKYIHQARDEFHGQERLEEAVLKLVEQRPLHPSIDAATSKRDLLVVFREVDRVE